ncbi:MAG TPA: alpha/beta hydrolase [Pirellulaceae bacterium]|nr:alpha/beta hydrolase [Pirellulaceae bacterium]
MIYLPLPTLVSDPPPPPLADIQLKINGNTTIHGRWCPYPESVGAILYLHGNAGNIQVFAPEVFRIQQATKMSVLIIDYPGYGRSEGSPSEQGCYDAAYSAYRWLTETAGIPAEQLVIYGESLGGAIAIDLASQVPHQALVLVRTFASMSDMVRLKFPVLSSVWKVANRFDSIHKIGLCRAPILLAQATHDTLVPYAQGERLREASSQPVQWLELRGHTHNSPLSTEFYEQLQQFVTTTRLSRETTHIASRPYRP